MTCYGTQTSAGAWKLMRAFDNAGVSAGFPSLGKNEKGCYTVQVANESAIKAGKIYMSERWD